MKSSYRQKGTVALGALRDVYEAGFDPSNGTLMISITMANDQQAKDYSDFWSVGCRVKPMPINSALINKLGSLPGVKGNFLTDTASTHGDYSETALKNLTTPKLIDGLSLYLQAQKLTDPANASKTAEVAYNNAFEGLHAIEAVKQSKQMVVGGCTGHEWGQFPKLAP